MITLGGIAELTGGELRGGNPATPVTSAAGLVEAREDQVTYFADRKMAARLPECRAACVLVKEFTDSCPAPQIVVRDPQAEFSRLLTLLHPRPSWPEGVSAGAYVAPDAVVGEGASIQAGAFVSPGARVGARSVLWPGVFVGQGASVGEDSVLYPNVVVMDGCVIGSRVILHAGAVIGADGYGYMQRGGAHVKIPQVGVVIVGDDVEIGANTTVDRATTGATIIGQGTKIDNQVQIAHNDKIGAGCLIVAQVAIGGSCTVGNGVVIGGQAAVADHVDIADGVMLAARAGVMSNLTKGVYAGTPVQPHREWLRSMAILARLPELAKRVDELERKLKADQGGIT